MINRNFVLEILVEVLHHFILVIDSILTVKHLAEDQSCILRLYSLTEMVDMHVLVAVVAKVSLPEVKSIFARDVIRDAKLLHSDL